MDDKENLAPAVSRESLGGRDSSLSPKKNSGRKGRSKSIGPGSLDEPEAPKQSAKDRRKSAFVPATKSILSKNEESERAARRKSMMNRRVSFAPEATLHTWDIIVDAKDHTTSTDSADSTRRASSFSRSSSSPGPSSDASQDDEDADLLSPPTSQASSQQKKRRRSGVLLMDLNNPEDEYSSGTGESGDESGSEEEEGAESGDDTGTAMSLDVDEATMQSTAGSENSTGSSERLERSLRQAAMAAGTRGIEYDEFGEMSMEIAEDEVTNAFKPWAQRQPDDALESARLDQENINPFSPAFKAEVVTKPATIEEDEEADISMDVTHAVGGILGKQTTESASSPMSDGTMDLTQAVGKITGQKRRRSAAEGGSPNATAPVKQIKRRRSSAARSSVGDDTMDLTAVVGGIQSTGSPVKPGRRRSLRNRRSSGAVSDIDDATMEFTRAVGGIQKTRVNDEDTLDGNEELSMELTTVLGGIRNKPQPISTSDSRPVTPQNSTSPVRPTMNTTPKDQERFKETPDMSAKKLLTPVLQKEAEHSIEKPTSLKSKGRKSLSPVKASNADLELPQAHTSTLEVASVKEDISYPELPSLDQKSSPIRTPMSNQCRGQTQKTPTSDLDAHLDATEQSPIAAKQQRSSPTKGAVVTPEKHRSTEDSRELTNSMKLLTTPRKEPLKAVTPKKQQTAKHVSPMKTITPKARPAPRSKETSTMIPSPVRRLKEDLRHIQQSDDAVEKIGLQDFLTKAGIRFMDLTTTKRRLTAAPTPSRARGDVQDDEAVTLESGVVTAACTVPELELYQHACHELKRYTKAGKQMISEIEATTVEEQPPLIQAYMHAAPDRKLALDAQMRDMKTNARFQSKGMWYSWRSQLLDELMTGLQRLGEGMIKDDEILGRSEEVLEQTLPDLVKLHTSLQQETRQLEESVDSIPENEKEELSITRDQLKDVNDEIAEKRRRLEALRKQVGEQDTTAEHLRDSKEEFTAAIQEANRIREASRGVSLDEITALKDSVMHLEDTFGWAITSASSSPSTLTMVYKSEVQLFFHPKAFQQADESTQRPNDPIRLSYIADSKKPLSTTLRFFLQLLRASLLGLPQCTTKISDLLMLVSNGWDTASAVAEAERRLNLEALTESRITSDEQLSISSSILLTKVKTKVRATFDLTASVDEDLQMICSVTPSVVVVYGEQYNEKNMSEFLKGLTGDGFDGWEAAVGQMREKLVARGPKGIRK